ncbi:TlpA family protein disulfide reductase [Pedobacter metabolipauper]|uniref:Thiol-disulfide isomerase/thioredoxin n=1 Tax=Pedobacter metabolipauper TaxID=425513 RepID=A0A4R6SZ92_9SPHI|nr:redoxin domain-containing protein [Pedobacter metabolipauper]TDQ11345.1 thiol-disulfide isomerase/thioredoxin [Pedobacter metabolipauper]
MDPGIGYSRTFIKTVMKKLTLAIALILFSASVFSQSLTPGTAIPKAVFYKADGKTFSTEQIATGKKTLLMFFDATCGHCQKVAADFSKRSKELSGVNLYLVSQDEFRSINYFLTNYGKPLMSLPNVTALQDKDHVFIPLFFPKQYPSLYLFGADKRLIYFSSNEKELPKFFSLIK